MGVLETGRRGGEVSSEVGDGVVLVVWCFKDNEHEEELECPQCQGEGNLEAECSECAA